MTSFNDKANPPPYIGGMIIDNFAGGGGASTGIEMALGTCVGSGKHALVSAFLAKHYGGVVGNDLREPIGTVTSVDHHSLVTSHLVHLKGTCKDGVPVDRPMPTIQAEGTHIGEVRAFLIKYFGTDQDPRLDAPLHTVTSKDRFGLVTIHGEPYQIVDIGMRMLTPRELFRAQGFPDWQKHFEAKVWQGHTQNQQEGPGPIPAGHEHARSARPSSSQESEPELSKPVAVSVQIDLGRKALELSNPELSYSHAPNVAKSASYPLPTAVAASARLLAGIASTDAHRQPSGKPFILRQNGERYRTASGAGTTPHAVDARSDISIEVNPSTFTTSLDGRISRDCEAALKTLFSYVENVTGLFTRNAIAPTNSYVVNVSVIEQYIIDPIYNGKPLTKTAQVRMCGNSVCPPVAAAIIRANFSARAMEKAA